MYRTAYILIELQNDSTDKCIDVRILGTFTSTTVLDKKTKIYIDTMYTCDNYFVELDGRQVRLTDDVIKLLYISELEQIEIYCEGNKVRTIKALQVTQDTLSLHLENIQFMVKGD